VQPRLHAHTALAHSTSDKRTVCFLPTHLEHALKQVALPAAEAAPVGQNEQRQALRRGTGQQGQQRCASASSKTWLCSGVQREQRCTAPC